MKNIEDWKLDYEHDDFCGSEFKTPKNGVLTVVGIAGKTRRGNNLYACHCSICHADSEMFPDLETITQRHLVRGQCPCACSNNYRWNDRQYRLRLKRKSADYEVISKEPIINALQKVRLLCEKDWHEWTSNVNNLLRGSGCPECALRRSSEQKRNKDPITPVVKRCSELGIKFHGFVGHGYINRSSRLYLECHCGTNWTPTFLNFINHRTGCPECAERGYNKEKAGVFYVVHWHKHDKEFLKYGITNKGESRITKQMDNTYFTPTILYFPEFNNGNVAAELEKKCHARRKQLYGRRRNIVVSKSEFEDGYTETMKADQWDWINNLVFENTMTKLKPIKKPDRY
ncbi:hypothetical protein [Aeromonas sp. R4-2]|uniref:zinc-ribbon domain-containing protein n=1 Tax=Aeromonas sp. R4-2 TaxID=3138465 RepID=UPI0034A142B5